MDSEAKNRIVEQFRQAVPDIPTELTNSVCFRALEANGFNLEQAAEALRPVPVSSAVPFEEKVNYLQACFPGAPRNIYEQALTESNGNVDAACDLLLKIKEEMDRKKQAEIERRVNQQLAARGPAAAPIVVPDVSKPKPKVKPPPGAVRLPAYEPKKPEPEPQQPVAAAEPVVAKPLPAPTSKPLPAPVSKPLPSPTSKPLPSPTSKPLPAPLAAAAAHPEPEVKPVETKPIEVKPIEVKPVEVKPAEPEPVEVKPVEVKPVEVKPVEVKPVETKPVEVKPAEPEPVEVKPAEPVSEVKPAEPVSEVKPAEPVSEAKPAEPVEVKPVEVKPAEPEPVEVKPVEPAQPQPVPVPSPSPSAEASAASAPSAKRVPTDECVIDVKVDGMTINFTWHIADGIELHQRDSICLYIHDREFSNKYECKPFLLEGKQTGSGEFVAPVIGCYDLRYFRDAGFFSSIIGFFAPGSVVESSRSEPFFVGPEMNVQAEMVNHRNIAVSWNKELQSKEEGKDDWLALYPVGTYSNTHYLEWVKASEAKEDGKVLFKTPRTPGEYEVRYFFDLNRHATGYAFSGKSAPIVVPNDDKIEVTNTHPVVEVKWQTYSQEPNSSDWIGLFTSSDEKAKELGRVYLNSGFGDTVGDNGIARITDAEGICRLDVTGVLPDDAANWEVRLYNQSSGKKPFLTTPYLKPK